MWRNEPDNRPLPGDGEGQRAPLDFDRAIDDLLADVQRVVDSVRTDYPHVECDENDVFIMLEAQSKNVDRVDAVCVPRQNK